MEHDVTSAEDNAGHASTWKDGEQRDGLRGLRERSDDDERQQNLRDAATWSTLKRRRKRRLAVGET